MHPVSGVDNADLRQVAGQQVGRAGMGMTQDNDIHAHSLEGQAGVQQGFALFHAAAGNGHIDDIGAQHLAGFLKRDAGAGAGFIEQGNDDPAAQGRDFLKIPAQDGRHSGRAIQYRSDFRRRKVIQIQHIAPGRVDGGTGENRPIAAGGYGCRREGHSPGTSLRTRTASSWPSVSVSRTLTCSSRLVGMFLPT